MKRPMVPVRQASHLSPWPSLAVLPVLSWIASSGVFEMTACSRGVLSVLLDFSVNLKLLWKHNAY